MLSSCCKQLLKKCLQVHGLPRFGGKVSTNFDSSRRMFQSSAISSSSNGSYKVPVTGSADDAVEAELDGTTQIFEEGDADISATAGDESELPPPEGDDEEALEARRLYYAKKVTGGRDLFRGYSDDSYVPLRESKIDELGRSYGTGKRKTSIARVWIKDGSGVFVINDRRLIDYFPPIQREDCLGSFVASKTSGLFDVWCTVKGGGVSGQSGAIRLGIARALEAFNPMYRQLLAPAGMLTRDSRRVERKKPGQKKARKQYQWVKR